MKFFACFQKMNKLGTAMVEYAVILAFVAAVGSSFTSDNGMASSITAIINKATNVIGLASGETSSTNKPYKLPGFANEADAEKYGAYIDKICELIFNAYSDKHIAGFKYKTDGNLNFLYVYEKDQNGNDKIVRYQYPDEYPYGNDKTVEKTNINDMLKNSNITQYNMANNADFIMCFDQNGNITQQMPEDVTGRVTITTKIPFQEMPTQENDKPKKTTFIINSDGKLNKN